MRRMLCATIGLVTLLSVAAWAEEPASTEVPRPETTQPVNPEGQTPREDSQPTSPSPADAASTKPGTSETVTVATAKEHAVVESEVEKHYRRLGYVPLEKNGRRYYCRDEAPMGTRVKKAVCISEEAAEQRRQDARRAMEEKFGQRKWEDRFGGP